MPLVLLLLASLAQSQNQARLIKWSDRPRGSNPEERGAPPLQLLTQIDGVEIAEVKVEGAPITIGKPFNASADWLRNLSFRVKNVSSEPFTFVHVTLTLPQVKIPPEIPYVACWRMDDICLKPGDEIELRIPAGGLYDWVKSTVADQGRDISTITEATVKYMLVRLSNGTQWSSGCVKTRDPQDACPHPSGKN